MKDQSLIAAYQSKIDQLETELTYLNHLLIDYGFSEGIKTLKEALLEISSELPIEKPFE